MDPHIMESQLPNHLQGYILYIRACLQADPTQLNTICYVTIHESFVKKGRTQRRPGLHIEYPGKGPGGSAEFEDHGWGDGFYQKDGIYMASNISNSCAVWNCRIVDRDDKEQKEIIGHLGSIEHLRTSLSKQEKYKLEEQKLYWITDRTPHEALPMKHDGYRQFFRLVGHKLGAWYEHHSTQNPIGIKPDKTITKIVKGNKFKR
eukprot:171217_1